MIQMEATKNFDFGRSSYRKGDKFSISGYWAGILEAAKEAQRVSVTTDKGSQYGNRTSGMA